ncbi:type 1 glutamine amidotransferase domain-containing protein [Paraglaciecola sp.]|uniref:type 1 glutamine amidotransferase domain-containing protein n=1 Tax=Paraglaciecola sp. TaxID=1920173 RepID=UPI003264CCB4
MLKKILITTITIVVLVLSLGAYAFYWLSSFMPKEHEITALKASQPSALTYLQGSTSEHRGKILAVVTSTNKMGQSNKKTGYELTELSRAYWVFTANGFKVDVASVKGGKAPVVIDADDMGEYDYAFLNDPKAQQKVTQTLFIDDVDPNDYAAVYFVGGKGAMFDFPNNPAIQKLVKNLHENNKIITAVCHGPAALVNVKLDNNDWLITNKDVSGFTNDEELFLIPDAQTIFPFLLQDKLSERGANFQLGETYLEKVVQDGQLITGQNPWSVWTLAEKTIEALGYDPIPREITAEENSIQLLTLYKQEGYKSARSFVNNNNLKYQQVLIVMHSIVAFMKMNLSEGLDLLLIANALR